MQEIELFSEDHIDYEEWSNEEDFLIEGDDFNDYEDWSNEEDFLIEDDYDEDCDDNNSGYQDDDLNDYLDEYL